MELFRGRFEAKLDPKGRLLLPAPLRQILPNKDSRVVFTNSQNSDLSFLDMYPVKTWTRLEKKIAQLPSLKAEVQAFKRFYLSAGQIIEPDSQNRLLVPLGLRKYANLDAEVVVVGMGDKLEIWAKEKWDRLYDGLAQSFDETLSAISGLTENLDEEN